MKTANGILLLFNSFVNPIALEAIAWKYYIVYIVLLVFMVVIVFLFFPETRGHSLESIAEIFEGPAQVWKHQGKVSSSVDMAAAENATKDGTVTHVEEKI